MKSKFSFLKRLLKVGLFCALIACACGLCFNETLMAGAHQFSFASVMQEEGVLSGSSPCGLVAIPYDQQGTKTLEAPNNMPSIAPLDNGVRPLTVNAEENVENGKTKETSTSQIVNELEITENQNPQTDVKHQTADKGLRMAIVIDDFGYDRKGVEQMLNLNCQLTVAVMPSLEFSEQDAKTAHEHGHEVILHMPMEAFGNAPTSWYGPLYIANSDTPEVAVNKLNQGINSIPYCNGVNIHMGTAISKNPTLMRAILQTTKDRNLPFLDSRTIENTVCKPIAEELGAPFLERDVFLEVGGANYSTTTAKLQEAIDLCKQKGTCIVIGHIGSVGKDVTARVLQENLQKIKDSGIQIVPLSALYANNG